MSQQAKIFRNKPCVKCGSTEERDKRGKCRACVKARREAHREKDLARMKAYCEAHRKEIVAYQKAYQKAYRETHREEIVAQKKVYNEAHREEHAARHKAYREAHREELAAKRKAYNEAHREERAAYQKARIASDPLYRLKCYIRIKTAIVLRAGGYSKRSSTAVILGCTFEEFKVHLEKQFWPGMSWENTGEWHLDHIIPLASAKTEGETLRLCHFSNLQPLWGDDNLSKNDRLDWTPAESQHPLHENDY